MKQIFGKSPSGNLKEAVKNIQSPDLLILMSTAEKFEEHVAELESLFPGVPSIGCVGISYDTTVIDKGVGVVALSGGITAVANVLEQVSTMPAKYISRIEEDFRKIGGNSKNTVCLDLCTGNDDCVMTTIQSVLEKHSILQVGGTGDAGKVCANGKVYQDADVYALIKNQNGKVGVYKENIYQPMPGTRLVASKADRDKYYVGELNGKPAKQVYTSILNVDEKDIATATFRNPLGKMNKDDICIVALKEAAGNGICCYRQVNNADVLMILELQDYEEIAKQTVAKIKSDFGHISGVFSINCAYRHLIFSQKPKGFENYLSTMSALGNHAGVVGYGEHFKYQFVNQTMTCVVFE